MRDLHRLHPEVMGPRGLDSRGGRPGWLCRDEAPTSSCSPEIPFDHDKFPWRVQRTVKRCGYRVVVA